MEAEETVAPYNTGFCKFLYKAHLGNCVYDTIACARRYHEYRRMLVLLPQNLSLMRFYRSLEMAIYHCNKSEVQRSKGQNAVGASAYISRSKLQLFANAGANGNADEKASSATYNFRHLKGLAHSVILAPDGSPDWVYDREQLWNKAEEVEVRVNSETARKLRIALPKELTIEQNIELIEEFALECLVSHGMVADINVHYDNEENPIVPYNFSKELILHIGPEVLGLV